MRAMSYLRSYCVHDLYMLLFQGSVITQILLVHVCGSYILLLFYCLTKAHDFSGHLNERYTRFKKNKLEIKKKTCPIKKCHETRQLTNRRTD